MVSPIQIANRVIKREISRRLEPARTLEQKKANPPSNIQAQKKRSGGGGGSSSTPVQPPIRPKPEIQPSRGKSAGGSTGYPISRAYKNIPQTNFRLTSSGKIVPTTLIVNLAPESPALTPSGNRIPPKTKFVGTPKPLIIRNTNDPRKAIFKNNGRARVGTTLKTGFN